MINFKQRRKKLLAEINVVPYIDVMLVLLVIFMVTTPLLAEGIHVELPKAAAKVLPTDMEPIVVTVDSKGEYYLNLAADPERPIAPSILSNRVAAELATGGVQKRPVLVKGDRNVAYQKVMQAMVLLQQAGATQVGLVTEDIQK